MFIDEPFANLFLFIWRGRDDCFGYYYVLFLDICANCLGCLAVHLLVLALHVVDSYDYLSTGKCSGLLAIWYSVSLHYTIIKNKKISHLLS